MAVKERLKEFISFKKMSDRQFSLSIGASGGYVNSISRSIQPDKIHSISVSYPELNTEWLLTGLGGMLKNSEPQPVINFERKGIPYYNVDFICGFDIITNDQTVNPEYYIDFKQYNNADYWINASGDSMRPVIAPGDIIAIRQLPESEWQNHILYGEIYAIVTTQNRTIKKIRKSKLSDDYIRLIPENLVEFDEQDIPKQDITHVFQVLGCMKRLM